MQFRYATRGAMVLLLSLGVAVAEELTAPLEVISDAFQVSDQPLDGEVAGVSAASNSATISDQLSLEAGLLYPAESFRLVQDTSPVVAGPQLFESPADPDLPTAISTARFGGVSASSSLLSANRRHIANAPASSIVLGADSRILVTTDAGGLLSKSTSGLGITSQKRSPIVSDPRVRSSSIGQLVASGSYWFAARPDLDTLVSKIDSHLIQDMIVIKGPYAARYGPGFSFVDFDLLRTPRHANGLQTHGTTTTNFKTNGGQWYGRQAVWGGGEDYGFRVGYSNGAGNDYRTGDGSRIPTSYKTQNFDAAIGFDLNETSSLEFVYLRQEQSGVELPNNVYDIRFLESDGFEVIYEKRDAANFDLFTIEGWYNQTTFDGNNFGAGKRAFMPLLDLAGWDGIVDAQNLSTGYSAAMTWGEAGCTNLTVGTDLRYLRQNIDEFDQTTNPLPVTGRFLFNPFTGAPDNYPVPDARTENPGLFFELERPINERLTVSAGGRFDWVHTNAASTAPGATIGGDPDFETFFGVDSLVRNYRLPALYLTANYQVNCNVTANLAAGYAERAPTMFQQYAGAPLANIMAQYATSVVFGNPQLQTEKRWQMDAGVHARYDRFRAGATGYLAAVEDYITLDFLLFNASLDPSNGQFPLYGFVNTDLAVLGGGELYAEYDVSNATTLFATASYTGGRDKTVTDTAFFSNFYGFDFTASRDTLDEQPLPMMSPLQMRLGIRLQEPCDGRYGVEFAARIIDSQTRVATLLLEEATPGFTVLDLRGFWRPTEALTVLAGVENLTDNKYREHLDPRHFVQVYQPGFNFYSGVELNY